MKKFFGFGAVIIIFAVIICTGCVSTPPSNPRNTQTILPGGITSYGNGVYFFPFTNSDFGNQLAGFDKRPRSKIIAIALDVTLDGYENGHWVIFQEDQASLVTPDDFQRELLGNIVSYDDYAYYFPFTNEKFGQSLSGFIGIHPELSLTALDLDVILDGYDNGYWAIFQPSAEINA